MKIELKVPKGIGIPIGNGLRQVGIARGGAWRPIGLSLNRPFNDLHATPDIVQDVYAVMATITSLRYIPKEGLSGEFLKEKYVFTRELKTSDLNSKFFTIAGEDDIILTSLEEQPVELTIVYRFMYGEVSAADNNSFLEAHGERKESYTVFNSHHSNVTNFSFDVREGTLLEEKLILTVESNTEDEAVILDNALEKLTEYVAMVKKIVADKNPDSYKEVIGPNSEEGNLV